MAIESILLARSRINPDRTLFKGVSSFFQKLLNHVHTTTGNPNRFNDLIAKNKTNKQ